MTYDDLIVNLRNASLPGDIFDLDGDLDRQLRNLQRVCHPDKHPDNADEATWAFKRLAELHGKVATTLETFSSPTRTYEAIVKLNGDFCDVFICRDNFILKVVKSSRDNKLMQREYERMNLLQSKASGRKQLIHITHQFLTISLRLSLRRKAGRQSFTRCCRELSLCGKSEKLTQMA